MRRPTKFCVGILLMVTLLAFVLPTAVLAEEDSIVIMVSPNVLAINSIGGSVSLHADISYSLVVGTSLTVNDIDLPILYTFADDRGDLVVKCSIGKLKEIVTENEADEAVFVLTVYTVGGDVRTGTDTIGVASPNGK